MSLIEVLLDQGGPARLREALERGLLARTQLHKSKNPRVKAVLWETRQRPIKTPRVGMFREYGRFFLRKAPYVRIPLLMYPEATGVVAEFREDQIVLHLVE